MHEIGGAFANGIVEFWQLFRINGQITVENHENIAYGDIEATPNRIAFASTFLSDELEIPVRMLRYYAFYFLRRLILRISFYKNNFSVTADFRNSGNNRFNISAFVTAWNYDRT